MGPITHWLCKLKENLMHWPMDVLLLFCCVVLYFSLKFYEVQHSYSCFLFVYLFVSLSLFRVGSMRVPRHEYEGRRTSFRCWFSLSAGESKDQTCIARLVWQVLLPTEPFGQPSYFNFIFIKLETGYWKNCFKNFSSWEIQVNIWIASWGDILFMI